MKLRSLVRPLNNKMAAASSRRAVPLAVRSMSGAPPTNKLAAPALTYIKGEEMTSYTMDLIMDQWIRPYLDTSKWEHFDLSAKSRDDTEDQVLHDAVDSGKRLGAIFKEPTITPTEVQKEALGLKKAWGSPNGAMRRGWNGITISRDTIHIDGMELGYASPVLFERHAVGGEYSAGWAEVGAGKLKTVFVGEDGDEQTVDERDLVDQTNAVVTYHNPLDNVEPLAHHFFARCLRANVTPYVVTKKTVFKWQEGFWTKMKDVFDKFYKDDFNKAGLLEVSGGELQHLISDAATMQIIRWTDGGFGMAAHNYDGDMLTDEVSQVHRSPGFITSNLIGVNEDGSMIKEYEASHGTVADMWEDHLAGKETSLNPLGMVEALVGAIQHSVQLEHANRRGTTADANQEATMEEMDNDMAEVYAFASNVRLAVHRAMVDGEGTRDLLGPSGLTTEQFVGAVARRLSTGDFEPAPVPISRSDSFKPTIHKGFGSEIDINAMQHMFDDLDLDGNGSIDFEEFTQGLGKLGIQPRKLGYSKVGSPVEGLED